MQVPHQFPNYALNFRTDIGSNDTKGVVPAQFGENVMRGERAGIHGLSAFLVIFPRAEFHWDTWIFRVFGHILEILISEYLATGD